MRRQERVWITGASSGIGRAVALRFAAGGALVLASSRDQDALRSLSDESVGLPGRIASLPLDVTDRARVLACVARIEAEFGPIDRAILNAGTFLPVKGDDFDPKAFDLQFALNVGGVVNALAALLPSMRDRRRGQIALTGSLSGYRGLPRASAYGASKAAVMRMAESLRQDLRPDGVDIRLISPGFVRTPLTDRNDFRMPHLVSAEVAADRIYDGLVHSRRFEIAFPRFFALQVRLLSILPYGLYFPLLRRLTG